MSGLGRYDRSIHGQAKYIDVTQGHVKGPLSRLAYAEPPQLLHPVRLLIVSHSCVTPINQQIYAEIRKLTGWDFTLLVPETWNDEFGNIIQAANWPGFDVKLIKAPVHRNGNIIFHAYRVNLKRLLSGLFLPEHPQGLSTPVWLAGESGLPVKPVRLSRVKRYA